MGCKLIVYQEINFLPKPKMLDITQNWWVWNIYATGLFYILLRIADFEIIRNAKKIIKIGGD